MSEQVRQRAHVGSLGSLGFRRWLFASPKLLDQRLLRADDASSIGDPTSKHSEFRRLPRHNAAVERLQRGSMRVLRSCRLRVYERSRVRASCFAREKVLCSPVFATIKRSGRRTEIGYIDSFDCDGYFCGTCVAD